MSSIALSLFLVYFIKLCRRPWVKSHYVEHEMNVLLDNCYHLSDLLKDDHDMNICNSNDLDLLQEFGS